MTVVDYCTVTLRTIVVAYLPCDSVAVRYEIEGSDGYCVPESELPLSRVDQWIVY
jgi:hypothetical protein